MGFFTKNNPKKESAKKHDDAVNVAPNDQEKSVAVAMPKGESRGAAYRILLRPLLSEKTTRAESKGVYTFSVASGATKPEIMKAVERVYGVKPTQVRTVVVEGKSVRFGRTTGRRRGWKKALVTLPKGSTITIHTGV